MYPWKPEIPDYWVTFSVIAKRTSVRCESFSEIIATNIKVIKVICEITSHIYYNNNTRSVLLMRWVSVFLTANCDRFHHSSPSAVTPQIGFYRQIDINAIRCLQVQFIIINTWAFLLLRSWWILTLITICCLPAYGSVRQCLPLMAKDSSYFGAYKSTTRISPTTATRVDEIRVVET